MIVQNLMLLVLIEIKINKNKLILIIIINNNHVTFKQNFLIKLHKNVNYVNNLLKDVKVVNINNLN